MPVKGHRVRQLGFEWRPVLRMASAHSLLAAAAALLIARIAFRVVRVRLARWILMLLRARFLLGLFLSFPRIYRLCHRNALPVIDYRMGFPPVTAIVAPDT